MRVKLTVIPFVLALIACVGLKVMSIFSLDSDGLLFGLNRMDITYTVIGISIALLVVCIIINLFDRKTAPVYPVRVNPAAGALSVLSGAAILASSVFNVVTSIPSEENYIVTLICAALSIPAAISFIAMSKVHFAGKSIISGISALFIFPAIWACAELVGEFLSATKVSISVTDMSALFCFIFTALYLFSYSMIVSRIKGRNPVKACFIYGYPAVAVNLAFGIYEVITVSIEGLDLSRLLVGIMFIVLSAFFAAFILEMQFNIVSKDVVEVIESIPDAKTSAESESYIDSDDYDKLPDAEKKQQPDEVKAEKDDDNSTGLDGFIMGYESDEEKEPLPYLTKKEMKKAASSRLVFYNAENEAVKDNDKPKQDEITDAGQNVEAESDIESEIEENIPTTSYDSSIELIEDIQKQFENTSNKAADITHKENKPQKSDESISEVDRLLRELENKK